MVLVKILKRKDASSVVVAIIVAMIVQQPLMMLSGKPANIISGANSEQGFYYGPGGDWQSQYLFPIVMALLQLIFLELLCWVVVGLEVLGKKGMRKK